MNRDRQVRRPIAAASLWLIAWAMAPAARAADESAAAAFRPQPAAVSATVPAATASAAAPASTSKPADPLEPSSLVVVIRGDRALLSVDGRMLRVGDEVNGMRVARIDERGVLLAGPGRARQELEVSPQVRKRIVSGDAPTTKNGVRP